MQSFLETVPSTFNLDEDGYFSYSFGNAEGWYELAIEPLFDQQFHLALYKINAAKLPMLMWRNKVPIRPGYAVPKGPGQEQQERRDAIRQSLLEWLAVLDKADKESRYPVPS